MKWTITHRYFGLGRVREDTAGSRRYADPSTYLCTPEQWQPGQAAFCTLVGKPFKAADALVEGKEELHTTLAEQVLGARL